jgi:hypothetical protein
MTSYLVPTPGSGSGKEGGKMKIVTYNVNGLRPRITQFGSLRNLLNSFDADIICFQVRSFVRSSKSYFSLLLPLSTAFTHTCYLSGDQT